MCGICGTALSTRDPEARDHVSAMQRRLGHRGPDSGGRFDCEGASLAVRRLAIIDLETGDQPVANEDGTVRVVQNGEVYNYRELAKELEGRGHVFGTRSDTEVIAHGYEEWGPDVFARMKGMFAAAVYDQPTRSLHLARDRFGEKPLFYWQDAGRIVFSSEVQSLLEHPDVPRRMSPEAVGSYLRLGFVPAPATFFKDVMLLPPGCRLRWTEGKCQVSPYWRPDYLPDPDPAKWPDAVEQVREALVEAVRRQMVADVEVGALLSGGIDSCALVAIMQSLSDRPVKTFTVRFDEAEYDESATAREVARHVGADHREMRVSNSGFEPDDLWRIVEHVGVPFPDSSAIPTYRISREVAKEVKVCIAGDGGDEVFGGYGVFAWAPRIERFAALPRPVLAGAARTLDGLATVPGLGAGRLAGRVRRIVRYAARPAVQRAADVSGASFFSQAEAVDLIQDPAAASVAGTGPLQYARLPEEAEAWTPLRRLMYANLVHNLPQDMLTKADRMSMAASVELRAPMLDPDLAALAMRLPDRWLVQGLTLKRVLREAVRPMLPDTVLSKPKTGFSLPLHAYQNKAFFDMADELLSKRDGPLSMLDADAVRRIKERAAARREDGRARRAQRPNHQLWALMQLAAWGERFKVSV